MTRITRITAAAIATLALGIGGTTAVFSVVDALFRRASSRRKTSPLNPSRAS